MLRDKEVLLISESNEQLGKFPVQDALEKAKEVALDLVLVSDKGDQPVCRFMDYGKYRYEQKRKLKDQRKKQHVQKNKEVKFHVRTDTHDYDLKLKRILEFLGKGHKVRISLLFRGREMAHRDLGLQRLKGVIADLVDLVHIDSPPKMSGRTVSAQLSPLGKKR